MALEVKNPPANVDTRETWVWSLSQEDSLKEGVATCSNILVWISCLCPMDRGSWGATVHGVTQIWTWLSNGNHSSTLAWKIPWTEEPGRLQSLGSLRVRHDWMASLSLFTFMHWRIKWHPLQCSCLENPRDGGAWWAAVYGVAQSRTRLQWLRSSKAT